MQSEKSSTDESEVNIFTFGCGQPNQGCYIRIIGSWDAARRLMFEMYGQKWSMHYGSEDQAGVERFNLELLAEYRVDQ